MSAFFEPTQGLLNTTARSTDVTSKQSSGHFGVAGIAECPLGERIGDLEIEVGQFRIG